MAFTPFAETDLPSMANYNAKFLECIADAVGQAPKIQKGSYTGTGSTSVTLTFSGKPILVVICGASYFLSTNVPITLVNGCDKATVSGYAGGSSYPFIQLSGITWGENTVTWTSNENYGANRSGYTYWYVAILE